MSDSIYERFSKPELIQRCLDLGTSRVGLLADNKRLRAENEALRTALKVIDTWARFDAEPRSGFSVAALDPKHVIELCNKALATPSEESKCKTY